MKPMHMGGFLFWGVLGLVLVAGCLSAPLTPSGFLGDYSGLKPDPRGDFVLYYENPNVPWKKYTKLMMDPVKVYYARTATNREIDPDELKKLTDYARDAVVEAVKDAYPVVNQAGSGVIRVRAAFTDLIAGRDPEPAIARPDRGLIRR